MQYITFTGEFNRALSKPLNALIQQFIASVVQHAGIQPDD